MELIRRAIVNGYQAIAITDHAGPGEMERFISETGKDCDLARQFWGIVAIPGVELTHLPPQAIPEVARQAKEMGAKLVVVHGETTVEPVEPGTNLAAAKSSHVDILAHPGLITPEEAALARENGIFLEISARRGHALTNDHVIQTARAAGARLLLNSDAHDEGDLLTIATIDSLLTATAFSDEEKRALLESNPVDLLKRI